MCRIPLLVVALGIGLVGCGREPSTLGPGDDAFGHDEDGHEVHPVRVGVLSPDTEPIPAEPGQRVATAQVAVAPTGEVELENADLDHDGILDDTEVERMHDPLPETRPPSDPVPPEPERSYAGRE